ncbi:DUF6264 family protein [Rathayibacter toxicus]|uniref:Uncharacterized protein n=1 Tax=Rathayibacter toxicus TaxID=145458 RepID=A0A0C5BAQ1_9MICO|nr:DUF6264 family protein [Rathayibacter toxicus]AJM77943.1 hypothetical protein TI83_08260 [Rathayibacter toxicus]ALS57856.1 hypothetical protein APU90_08820 [Rathayibacter toxicus]KKM46948.1 hypothetical protein VT73_01400 [Rathayibacter toxicus]PPG20470.1 hypothetical protein C5D15_08105 [Rathayibacter toxicus]PPG45572.1 hypothetical protein C5D16_08075 [Rathayibacter toxicus]
MTDAHDRSDHLERPQPQYGEYAPPGWSWQPADTEAIAPSPAAPDSKQSTPDTAPRPEHPADRLLTLLLLGLGVFFAVPTLLDSSSFARALTELYIQQGIGHYGSPELARVLGVILALAQSLIVTFAIWISLRRLRAGKRAIVVPVVGIVTTIVLSFVVAAIAILGDPTFAQHFSPM